MKLKKILFYLAIYLFFFGLMVHIRFLQHESHEKYSKVMKVTSVSNPTRSGLVMIKLDRRGWVNGGYRQWEVGDRYDNRYSFNWFTGQQMGTAYYYNDVPSWCMFVEVIWMVLHFVALCLYGIYAVGRYIFDVDWENI